MKNYSLLFVLSFAVFFLSCTNRNLTEKNTLAFDAWDELDKGIEFRPVSFYKSEAPSKIFCAEVSWEDPDEYYGRSMLSFIHVASGQRIEVGRSIRGIDVAWVETQIGDLLLVKQHIDTHHNETFVLFPLLDRKELLSCSVLYATPNQDICESKPEGIPAEHIYSTIEHVSYDGVMTIEIVWSYFIPEEAGNTITAKIPLFYGFQKKP